MAHDARSLVNFSGPAVVVATKQSKTRKATEGSIETDEADFKSRNFEM